MNAVQILAAGVVGFPVIALVVLGLSGLLQRPLSESSVDRIAKASVALGFSAALGILGIMLWTGERAAVLDLGNFVEIGTEHFHFHMEFLFDRLSIPMVLMSFVLVGVIGSFANIYLQGDAGYHRFFLSFSMFLVGLLFAFLAGTIETLFFGWELVGLSSALLIAYFHERKAPVENGLWVSSDGRAHPIECGFLRGLVHSLGRLLTAAHGAALCRICWASSRSVYVGVSDSGFCGDGIACSIGREERFSFFIGVPSRDNCDGDWTGAMVPSIDPHHRACVPAFLATASRADVA